MSKDTMLWVLGEALMDGVTRDDGLVEFLPGGSPFNLARAAARQGVPVGWVTPLSTDRFGQQCLEVLAPQAVLLPRSPKPTSLALVQVEHGQAHYSFYREGVADRDYSANEVWHRLHQLPPGVLHTGSLMAVPPEHHKVLDIVRQARQAGWTISVDLNVRPRVASDPGAYRQAVLELAAHADWLKASDEDLNHLGFESVGLDRARALSDHFIGLGCRRVAITFGAQGASLCVGPDCVAMAAPVVEVVDTVGAGDTFWGTCLAEWMRPVPSAAALASASASASASALALASASASASTSTSASASASASASIPVDTAHETLRQTLARAVCAAALNCQFKGCQPPTREALDAWMARRAQAAPKPSGDARDLG